MYLLNFRSSSLYFSLRSQVSTGIKPGGFVRDPRWRIDFVNSVLAVAQRFAPYSVVKYR